MGFVASLFQPSTLRIAFDAAVHHVLDDGSSCLCFDPGRLPKSGSSCSRSIAFVVRALRHWLGGRRLTRQESPNTNRLDRPQPSLPMKPGRAGTMTHDYTRHGTTMLFAAARHPDGHCQRNTLVPLAPKRIRTAVRLCVMCHTAAIAVRNVIQQRLALSLPLRSELPRRRGLIWRCASAQALSRHMRPSSSTLGRARCALRTAVCDNRSATNKARRVDALHHIEVEHRSS